MKTQYYTATSLDGFIATEDDSLEWLFPLGDLNDSSYPAFIAEVGALAMGSATYEWMLRNAHKCALVGKRIVMLHSFINKSDEIPLRGQAIAERRLKEIKHAKS